MKTPSTHITPEEKNLNPINPRTDIGHVHLRTADIERIYQFYVGILGFDVIKRMEGALFLSAGGYHHDLAFNTWESVKGTPPALGTTGLYHVAIRYPDRVSLADALNRLIKAKWPLQGTNDHGTHEALYLSDPDQNGLELYYDRPESEWPLTADGHLDFVSGPINIESLLAS